MGSGGSGSSASVPTTLSGGISVGTAGTVAPGTVVEGNLTQQELEAEKRSAETLNNKLKDTERIFGGALKSTGKDKGPGDDGQVPASGTRQSGDSDGAGCQAVDSEWAKFNASADATLSNPSQSKINQGKA